MFGFGCGFEGAGARWVDEVEGEVFDEDFEVVVEEGDFGVENGDFDEVVVNATVVDVDEADEAFFDEVEVVV